METRRRSFGAKPVRLAVAGAVIGLTLAAAGCSTTQTLYQGYVVDEQMLQLIKQGSSREQVLLTLGQPSTTATFDNEVFYYISQQKQRTYAFQKPRLISQEILAVYFGSDGRVEKVARYTLQDGHVVDMVSDTTPTGGKDLTFIQQILSGSGKNSARNFFDTAAGNSAIK